MAKAHENTQINWNLSVRLKYNYILNFSAGLYYTPDSPDATNVAIKILKEGVSNEVKEDFDREVEIMSNFSHDNILSLLGVITKGKRIFQ